MHALGQAGQLRTNAAHPHIIYSPCLSTVCWHSKHRKRAGSCGAWCIAMRAPLAFETPKAKAACPVRTHTATAPSCGAACATARLASLAGRGCSHQWCAALAWQHHAIALAHHWHCDDTPPPPPRPPSAWPPHLCSPLLQRLVLLLLLRLQAPAHAQQERGQAPYGHVGCGNKHTRTRTHTYGIHTQSERTTTVWPSAQSIQQCPWINTPHTPLLAAPAPGPCARPPAPCPPAPPPAPCPSPAALRS